MPPQYISKNIVYGNITAGGDVHIGDIIYNAGTDFQHSILFLRIEREKENENGYLLTLSVKSKHAHQARLGQTGEGLLREPVKVDIPVRLFNDLAEFQSFRRSIETPFRHKGLGLRENFSIQAIEEQLAKNIHQTFFAGDIGRVCTDFIRLLEEQRIKELLLAVSADDEKIVNLPFEMVLPLLFPAKLGEAKKSMAVDNFGLVRTKTPSLADFNMQGDHALAAPLKMLFITALPENLSERGKMLQIEEEQTRLIRSVGALEATGDQRPKIVIEFLENASLNELSKALHARQHDIVHISGHGAYLPDETKGVLYFENEDGDEEKVTGKALGETLRQHACVKLLILSACETAIAGSEGGVTEQIASYGIPGILAMRFAVTDEGAKVFTTELYTKLAQGRSLTRAVANAREAMYADIALRREQPSLVQHIAEWFTPVVYQNQAVDALIADDKPYHLPDNFYPRSSFLKTRHSRLIGEGFIGRKRYLIQMRRAFRAGRRLCLHGMGGLGKTTLAEAFAHNYDNHSHSTVIFRNGHQINEAFILQALNKRFANINPELAEQLQQAIDDQQTDVLSKLQLLIDNYLRGRKVILIFDNAEDVQTDEGGAYQRRIGNQALSAFLRHLCENAPHDCHILFTTRYKMEDLADIVDHIALDKMGYAEQYRLLNYSETLRGIPLQEREEVHKRLDGHPRGYEYLEALLKKDRSFDWQQVAKSEADVFENLLLAKVYERLTGAEKNLFQMAATFITRTPVAALAAVSGEAETDLVPALQALHDWSLCFLEQDGRFEVHRLTREWVLQNKIPPEKMKEWAFKAGAFFQGQPTWNDEILAKDYYELAEAWTEFAETSFRLQNHYQLIGLYPQAFELNQAVLEKNVGDQINADALNYNGMMLIAVGQYDAALRYLEQSLAIRQQIGDRQGEGAALNNISQIYDAKGDYDTALRFLEQALAIRQEIGDRQGEGATLNNLATTVLAKGDYDTALHFLEQALAIQQEIGNRQGEGATLNNISQIHKVISEFDAALRFLEQALAIQQQIGDRKGEGASLNNISQIYDAKGDNNTALHYLEKALAIQQEIGDRKGKGTTLNNISQIYDAKGDYDTALRYLEQALVIQQEIGDRKGEGTTLNNISQIYNAKGDHDKAFRFMEQALVIQQQIGDRQGEGATLNNVGTTAYAKRDYDTALRFWGQALAIRQQIGDRQGEGATLNNISQIYAAKGDYDTALRYLEQALAIQQEIGDISTMATTLNNIGAILFEQKQYEAAILPLAQAYQIYQKIGSPDANKAAGYLGAIIERIGEAKFQAVLSGTT